MYKTCENAVRNVTVRQNICNEWLIELLSIMASTLFN